MCRQIQERISASQLLTDMIASKRLTVLALYPDEDLELWRKHPLPKQWISSYDKGCKISKSRSYDLRAIPALYLLDGNFRVLVKDSTSVPQIEDIILNYGR